MKGDYSNLIAEPSEPPRNRANIDLRTARYSYRDLEDSKSVVDKFLNKEQLKSKISQKDNKVFSRLHNQAMVKQKKKREMEAKRNKSKSSKKMQHSKSTYLKENKLYTVDFDTKKKRKPMRERKSKDLEYDATIGHRLYVKSRGFSSKREQSIRKIKRRKSLREK